MKFLKKLFSKKLIIILIVIVAIVLAIFALGKTKTTQSNVMAKEYTIERGDIDSTISGKATVQPNDQYTVTSVVSGDVLNTFFEEGDIVEKDSVMYEIDSSDVSKSIESADLSIQKANLSLNTTNDSLADLTIISNYSGTVKDVAVKVGDMINNGQTLAKVYNDTNMLIKIPFNENDANNIYAGQTAIVTLSDNGTEIYGTVNQVSSSSYSLSGYMRVKDVEIRVSNPGSIQPGAKAMAMIGDYACNSAGAFENSVDEEIKATASGKIVSLNLKENGKVSRGSVVAILDSENLLTQKRNNELTIQEAQLAKSRTLDALDDYTITAPITGTVITKDIKTGDKLDNTKGATTLATIYDLSSLKFDMDVDELDIAKVKVGQEVEITADAVPDKTYIGYVEKININGTSQNGVTSYPVTVRINDFEDLLPGMNIDAEIIIEKVENVIIMPSECLNRGNTVYVKGVKTDDTDEAPDGFKTVKVETGLADTEYIEIVSGLKEGDIVRGTEITANNKIMEQMEEMHDAAHSGDFSSMQGSNIGGGMGGPGGAPGGMR